jgi:16S rRNA processing protein RimM
MLLEVGRIVRPHGIKGEVIVELVTNRTERVAPGTVLDSDRGPMTVLASSPHQGRWIVAFDGVPDRTAAEALRGLVLSAEPVVDDDALWIHQLIGSRVVDTAGHDHGRVETVEANPAADLLILDGGGIVPLTFVVGHQAGTVVIDPPAGLLDPLDPLDPP